MFDPHYVFLMLATEIGTYQALQRTVTASTIPHIQTSRLGEILVPIIPKDKQDEIKNLIKEAFRLKNQRKNLIKYAKQELEVILDAKPAMKESRYSPRTLSEFSG